jgi:hypothetical protein
VDLMAGGRNRQVADLLTSRPRLRILGVDRDPSGQELEARHGWTRLELGAGPDGRLGLDFGTLLQAAFPEAPRQADVIVAKKALHEIDRRIQPDLLELSARAMVPGGRLVLFIDCPGPPEGSPDQARLGVMHRQLESLRRSLLADWLAPAAVARALEEPRFDGSPMGQAAFLNAWVMVKDWTNLNRHEVAHRYFASESEVRAWAAPWFGQPIAGARARYRIKPPIFNEIGIQRALRHLTRSHGIGPGEFAKVAGWISGTERFRLLLDFTRRALADAGLARALAAGPDPVSLATVHPALGVFDSAEPCLGFELPCAVLVFEKPAG